MGEVGAQEFRPKSLDFFERLRFAYKKPTIEGRENLPQNPCVVSTTHLSGFDIPEVYAEVTKDRKTGISMQASILNHRLFRPIANIVGKENFFPLSNRNSSVLRGEELNKMTDAIKEGRTMVVPAHRPTRGWKLPDEPGLAAVILAHKANIPLVPVVLDIASRIPVREKITEQIKHALTKNHPDSKIVFGNPISFTQIAEDKLQLAINLYSPEKRKLMIEEQIQEAQTILNILKSEAGEVMKALASNLSPEKRGKWR